MNTSALIQALGSIGLFPSRVFLPALITALLLRFGGHLPLLAHSGLLAHVHNHPTWFTHDITLVILAALAALEIVANKNPEARHLVNELDAYLKGGVAALTTLGVISSTDASFVNQTLHHAGWGDYVAPIISAAGTFRVTLLRRAVFLPLHEHAQGTHLDQLISWAEETWVAFGALVLVLFPLLMLAMMGAGIGVLLVLRRRMEIREEQIKFACPRCGSAVYGCAMACSSCRLPVPQPRAVGLLGGTKPYADDRPAEHPYRLFEKRRCPVCATRLKARMPYQNCAACGQAAPADAAFVDAYLAYLTGRVPVVLGISFLFSLVPIFGLIAGTIYYRMVLVLPVGQYMPFGRQFLLRWGIRVLFLVMVFLQVVPLLGGVVVPVMATISFAAYRSSYRKLVLAEPAAVAPPPLPHAGLAAP